MYMKIIGSLFLMSSAAAIGFLKADELKERIKRLEELKRMMMLLQGELRFHRAELAEAFENVAERMTGPLESFLKELSDRLKTRETGGFEHLWGECSKLLVRCEGFAKEDYHLLELLGNSLGYLDLTMQTETLNLTIIQTDEAIAYAKKQQESKGKLYQTMGVTVGALLTLLMI